LELRYCLDDRSVKELDSLLGGKEAKHVTEVNFNVNSPVSLERLLEESLCRRFWRAAAFLLSADIRPPSNAIELLSAGGIQSRSMLKLLLEKGYVATHADLEVFVKTNEDTSAVLILEHCSIRPSTAVYGEP